MKRSPRVAVDLVVVGVDDTGCLVLLLEHKKNGIGLPGGFLCDGESIADASRRILEKETDLDGIDTKVIGVFSEPGRDPSGWVLSVGCLALVPSDRLSGISGFWVLAPMKSERGFSLAPLAESDIPERLALDHDKIVAAALLSMRHSVERSPIAFDLLPKQFTLPQAQRVLEAVTGRHVDKAGFRTSLLSRGLVTRTGEERRNGGAHRPAMLYVRNEAAP